MIDPLAAFCFSVTIDGVADLGRWTKCDGLTVEYDVHEYKEGGQNGYVHRLPGRAKYQNIKLTRYVDPASTAVAAWMASIQAAVKRQTAQIAILDPVGSPIAVYDLADVFPVRWTGPSLDVGSNSAATETLELAHNGFLGPR